LPQASEIPRRLTAGEQARLGRSDRLLCLKRFGDRSGGFNRHWLPDRVGEKPPLPIGYRRHEDAREFALVFCAYSTVTDFARLRG
jgi:hypothetical protein